MRASGGDRLDGDLLPALLSATVLRSNAASSRTRYGLSWQIVPRALPALLTSKDPAKSRRVVAAMMQMSKIDIRKLEQAAEGP